MTITVEQMVQREVMCCMSSLVSTLALGGHGAITHNATHPRNPRLSPIAPLMELADQAAELSYPIPCYEEAARQAGWRELDDNPMGKGVTRYTNDVETRQGFDAPLLETWQEACEHDNLEPYEWEVFEHWAVTPWLAEQLIAEGEKVDTDFGGLNVWARTCTGQSIACDCVMHAIHARLVGGED
jgi:hypothetical protein